MQTATQSSNIEQIVQNSGLWNGNGAETHGFRLSPSLVAFTTDQAAALEALGPAITTAMDGVSRLLAIAQNPELAKSKAWRLVRKVTDMQVPTFMLPLQAQFPARTPLIVKVDFMEDAQGNFHIAELDATNRRGLGYTSLFELIRTAVSPTSRPVGRPIVNSLAELVRQVCGPNLPAELGYVYAHKERFYLPEFMILKRELMAHGVELLVGDEKETRVKDDTVFIRGQPCRSGLLTDFALKLEERPLTDELVRLYANKQLRLLIPPRPFLGSKALLALLHNADHDPQLEAVLCSQICPQVLRLLRTHIPVTRFVTKHSPRPERGVLKEVMSSGMHGVYFAGSEGFDTAFADAVSRPYQYVLQDEIDCRPRSFEIFTPQGVVIEELRTRLIVYYVNRQLSGGVVTAGQGKRIHGGGQAVFTSTVRA